MLMLVTKVLVHAVKDTQATMPVNKTSPLLTLSWTILETGAYPECLQLIVGCAAVILAFMCLLQD